MPRRGFTRDTILQMVRDKLTGALTGINLADADLQGIDLSFINLEEAILTRANLQGANLRFANFMKAEFGTKSNFRRSALLGMQIPRLRAQMRWKRIPYNRLPADFRFEPANLHSQARASGNYFPKAQSGKFWFHELTRCMVGKCEFE